MIRSLASEGRPDADHEQGTADRDRQGGRPGMSRLRNWMRVALVDLRGDLRRFGILLACLALGTGDYCGRQLGGRGAASRRSCATPTRCSAATSRRRGRTAAPMRPRLEYFRSLGQVAETIDSNARGDAAERQYGVPRHSWRRHQLSAARPGGEPATGGRREAEQAAGAAGRRVWRDHRPGAAGPAGDRDRRHVHSQRHDVPGARPAATRCPMARCAASTWA